jgi:hypothetical protein
MGEVCAACSREIAIWRRECMADQVSGFVHYQHIMLCVRGLSAGDWS